MARSEDSNTESRKPLPGDLYWPPVGHDRTTAATASFALWRILKDPDEQLPDEGTS